MKRIDKRFIYHLKKYNQNFEITDERYYRRHRRLITYKRAIEKQNLTGRGGVLNKGKTISLSYR